MGNIAKRFLLAVAFVAVFTVTSALAADNHTGDSATCDITITVDSIIEWDGTVNGGDFTNINLSSIDSQSELVTGSSMLTLYTNANVELSADITGTEAQLTHERGVPSTEDTLVTEYDIITDGDGDPATGATADAILASGTGTGVTRVWSLYSAFLSEALDITHYNTDGACEVTLYVRASNDSGNVADRGDYEATQTITATFVSDN